MKSTSMAHFPLEITVVKTLTTEYNFNVLIKYTLTLSSFANERDMTIYLKLRI